MTVPTHSQLEDTHLQKYLYKNHYEVVKEPRTALRSDIFKTNNRLFAIGGDDRDRTGDLWLAKPPLSQLSYIPESAHKVNGPKWS